MLKAALLIKAVKEVREDLEGFLEKRPPIKFTEIMSSEAAMARATKETKDPAIYPNDIFWHADRMYRYGVYSGKINSDEDYGDKTISQIIAAEDKKVEEKLAPQEDTEIKHEKRDSYIPATVLQSMRSKKEDLDMPGDTHNNSSGDDKNDEETGEDETRLQKKFNKIPGGLAQKKKPSDFDQKALKQGMAVEKEHTTDPSIAEEIAMDHLTEDPRYYEKLKKMEKHLKVWDPLVKSWVNVF